MRGLRARGSIRAQAGEPGENARGIPSPTWHDAALRRRVHEALVRAKPTIAAVQGWCIGGGTEIVLCADLIVAAEAATFGYPPLRVWGTPTTAMWVYRLGLERAKRYLLTGAKSRRRRQRAWADPRGGARRELDAAPPRWPNGWPGAGEPARDAQAAVQPDGRAHGTGPTRLLGTLFDGIARHTQEGLDFVAPGPGGGLSPGRAGARRSIRRLRLRSMLEESRAQTNKMNKG